MRNFLGRTADCGTVQSGRVADLVLLDADPLQRIESVRRISAVVFNGRVFDRGADLTLKTSSGRTALEFARLGGDTVAVAILEQAARRP